MIHVVQNKVGLISCANTGSTKDDRAGALVSVNVWRFRFRVSSEEKFRDYELFSINKDLQVSQFNKWSQQS